MALILGQTLCSSPVALQSGFETPVRLRNKIRSFGSSRGSSGLSISRSSEIDLDYPSLHRSTPVSRQDGAYSDTSPNAAATSIATELSAARVEWPEGSNHFFVPLDDMSRIFTTKAIAEELSHHTVFKDFPINVRVAVANNIKYKATKLYAILIHLRKGHLIWDFLKEKIHDSHLPFVRSDRERKSDTYRLYSKIEPQKRINCTRHWDRDSVIAFAREQWTVNAPVFKPASKIHHYEFHDNCILPFIRDEGRSSNVASGGFSTVWEVVIHPAHQKLYKTSNIKGKKHSFALKRLHSASKSEFDREVEMLKAFAPRNHRNLVKLLCTFYYKGEYYLLFPFAQSNLRQYWQNNPIPGLSIEKSRWVLLQCKAISSALHLIHEYRTTFEYASLPDITHNDRIYGRHGDIKPENILLLQEDVPETDGLECQNILLIADFGLMDLHRRLTRSLIAPGKINGSPSYEPPELRIGREVSQAYDIWSLGCVFLELLIWLALGWNEVEAFTQDRAEIGVHGAHDYKFFTVTNTQVTMRVSVKRWIQRLRDDPDCSSFSKDFLDIISKDMLIIDPLKRMRCGPLNETLGHLREKAQSDTNYFKRLFVA